MDFRLTAVIASAAFLIACTGTEPEVDPKEQGAALLAPFKAKLKNELVTSMESGLEDAIAACNMAAPAIAESLSVDGVVMGRSSHKLRNPDNVAPDWVAPVVDDYLAGQPRPVSVELGGGRHGYVEPIFMQPLCLTCHGETLAPEVAARIEELYPDDRATGFRTGDFRGVFWVEY